MNRREKGVVLTAHPINWQLNIFKHNSRANLKHGLTSLKDCHGTIVSGQKIRFAKIEYIPRKRGKRHNYWLAVDD